MTEPKPAQADGVDAMMQELLSLVSNNREKLIEAWTHGSEIYARYLTAVAEAKGPEDIIAANAAFVREEVEAFSEAAGAGPKLDGASDDSLPPFALPD